MAGLLFGSLAAVTGGGGGAEPRTGGGTTACVAALPLAAAAAVQAPRRPLTVTALQAEHLALMLDRASPGQAPSRRNKATPISLIVLALPVFGLFYSLSNCQGARN